MYASGRFEYVGRSYLKTQGYSDPIFSEWWTDEQSAIEYFYNTYLNLTKTFQSPDFNWFDIKSWPREYVTFLFAIEPGKKYLEIRYHHSFIPIIKKDTRWLWSRLISNKQEKVWRMKISHEVHRSSLLCFCGDGYARPYETCANITDNDTLALPPVNGSCKTLL